jgi:hypothetical protein
MSSIFEEAQDTVYGDPSKNLHVIANLWEMYLYRRGLMGDDSNNLRPDDVAQMMVLLKLAKLINQPGHRDSLIDICGYAGLVDRIHERT